MAPDLDLTLAGEKRRGAGGEKRREEKRRGRRAASHCQQKFYNREGRDGEAGRPAGQNDWQMCSTVSLSNGPTCMYVYAFV